MTSLVGPSTISKREKSQILKGTGILEIFKGSWDWDIGNVPLQKLRFPGYVRRKRGFFKIL